MKKIYSLWAAVILIAAIATACGGSGGTSETTDTATAAGTATSTVAASENPAATAGAAITIENMAFGEPLTVAPGAEIAVVNNDSVEHSVTSDTAGAFDEDVDGQQKTTLVAPSQPGEYPFHCSYHPSMKGTLIVK
jgi:plastocyanin